MKDAATTGYRVAVGALVLGIILVLLLTLWVARSIGRPLQLMGARASEVNDGSLDVPPLPAEGPREIRAVGAAFNDLVANLRLMDAKSQALATLDFAHPALAAPLPGRLGASIRTSLQVLSGSIEERDRLQQRLAHEATHDALTGIPNRMAAIAAVDGALARSGRSGETMALLYVDLNGFKLINDTHGHGVGDLVLQEVASRLEQRVRDGDVVARLGGDEFLVVAERTTEAGAGALAKRISASVGPTIDIGGRDIPVGASIGIALSQDGEHDAADFLVRADLALYRAKENGGARIEFFDESLQGTMLHRAEIEDALRATLQRGGDELELCYQPVVDGAGRIRSVEALVRWNRPGLGRLQPDAFIPIAELSNLIIDLDVWVLGKAARQAVAWGTTPRLEGVGVAVNVSGRHLLSGHLDLHVDAAVAGAGLDPHRLLLEITETVLLTDLASAGRHLEHIRESGVRIAIDDFGTGYTSLVALQRLPVDVIKVDRIFVSQVLQARSHSLVGMVTQLGHQLGITVVAEGVETEEQRTAIHALGADEIQGFLVSPPVPAEQLVSL